MMKKTISIFSSAVLLSATLFLLCGFVGFAVCREEDLIKMATEKMILGGFLDHKGFQNSLDIDSLARFAVLEHNKKENALLEFARVLKFREQVVAGKMYYLTLEAVDSGKKKMYEAKVWVKPWMNFKQLQEFKHAHGNPVFSPSDLGLKQGN